MPVAIADAINGLSSVTRPVSSPATDSCTSSVAKIIGRVNSHPSFLVNNRDNSSRSFETVARPMPEDNIPTVRISVVPRLVGPKVFGTRTVNDEMSWLDNIQYNPEPIRIRLSPGGVLLISLASWKNFGVRSQEA